MKGLLLAGGHGTRLRPLTYTGNKHMLPIANRPMLSYGLEHLRNAGVVDVGVVLGPIKEGVREVLGDGSGFGVRITYLDQPEPKGLADAVLVAESFLGDDSFVMYLGDNLLREGVARFRGVYEETKADCVIGVTPVSDPSRFGVAELEGHRVLRLVEKPSEPRSNLALVGVYVFGPSIIDAAKRIRPSPRNELEITDAIQRLVDDGRRVEPVTVEGWWKDTGKPEDLLEANQLVLSDLVSSVRGELSEETRQTGALSVGRGTRTTGRVSIRGPVIIGEDCSIGPNVHIGPYTSIGSRCTLVNVDIENSIVMSGCRIETGKRIVDSLIGSNSTVVDGSNSLPHGERLIVGENSFAQI